MPTDHTGDHRPFDHGLVVTGQPPAVATQRLCLLIRANGWTSGEMPTAVGPLPCRRRWNRMDDLRAPAGAPQTVANHS